MAFRLAAEINCSVPQISAKLAKKFDHPKLANLKPPSLNLLFTVSFGWKSRRFSLWVNYSVVLKQCVFAVCSWVKEHEIRPAAASPTGSSPVLDTLIQGVSHITSHADLVTKALQIRIWFLAQNVHPTLNFEYLFDDTTFLPPCSVPSSFLLILLNRVGSCWKAAAAFVQRRPNWKGVL